MFEPVTVKMGCYTLKEVPTSRGLRCKIYVKRRKIAEYLSVRQALFHSSEWRNLD